MNFHQMIPLVPLIDHIQVASSTLAITSSPSKYQLVIVRQGHFMLHFAGHEPIICSQAYACHPNQGDYTIQVPRTKIVDYVVITYTMVPDEHVWTLQGHLTTLSEIKIHYMLDEIIRRTQELTPQTAQDDATHRMRMRMMLERILFIYLHESDLTHEKKSAAESIEGTISYINEHYMLELTLPMLARRAGMSVGYFTVLFKKMTGKTLMSYLYALRIEKAKIMFLQTDLLAKEIASRVGFVDYFHFSKVFKKKTGYTPSEYVTTHSKI
ncbi:AraC family transcriptional regulator [Paenibacillus sp. LjRoot153]|uniref:helix-turn-helix transcriptional regulator n=1 Tax=Paenibacillus sp. LjRoot153 TaxID=3342270 RepID=UPI003ECD3BF1